MDRRLFELTARAALRDLPKEFRPYLDNVELFCAERPTPEQLEDAGADDLLGLFVGVPLTVRGAGPSFTFAMPDTVWLFRRPLIAYCREHGLDLKTEIKRTLLHEVGHHLGLSEEELEELEKEHLP